MLRTLVVVIVAVLALLPTVAQAETVFMPDVRNGVRNWFTAQDVVKWIAESNNVMPVSCVEVRTGIFETCTVQQAQPLTLTWDDVAGKVVAR